MGMIKNIMTVETTSSVKLTNLKVASLNVPIHFIGKFREQFSFCATSRHRHHHIYLIFFHVNTPYITPGKHKKSTSMYFQYLRSSSRFSHEKEIKIRLHL